MSEYQIEPNNYVEPEVRKEVVQRLINFFIKYNGLASSITIGGHCAFKGLKRDIEQNRDVIYTCYEQVPSWYNNRVEVRQCEMEEFCKVWVENGYFISRAITKWGHPEYVFSKSPYTQYDFKLVNGFKDTM